MSTAAKDSPPGGARRVEPSQASSSAGQRSRTSAKVSPSHSPKSHSTRSGSTTTGGDPVARAISSAVRVHRDSGDVTTAATGVEPTSLDTRRAVAVAWATPRSESGTSPRPE